MCVRVRVCAACVLYAALIAFSVYVCVLRLILQCPLKGVPAEIGAQKPLGLLLHRSRCSQIQTCRLLHTSGDISAYGVNIVRETTEQQGIPMPARTCADTQRHRGRKPTGLTAEDNTHGLAHQQIGVRSIWCLFLFTFCPVFFFFGKNEILR